jgi:hypothetical protein
MNKNSKIANYIYNNPNTWQEDFDGMSIRYSTDGNYTIFVYNINADFSNEIVQEARGIILDNELNVVCWPFRKFGNSQESYVDEIDWSTARVQDKLDGSIVKLWFDGKWNWSTNGVVYAEKATWGNTDFLTVIQSAVNYKDINFNTLNKNRTYIFELVSPMTQVVIHYNETKLYHLGTRDNITGQEYNEDIGIEKPKEYPLTNLKDCLVAVEKLNDKQVDYEGFVVVDANWNRIKIKNAQYLVEHRYKTGVVTKRVAVDIIITGEGYETAIEIPYAKLQLKWYEYQLANVEYKFDSYMKYARNLYKELSFERKAFANTIKNDELSFVGFQSLKDVTAKDIMLSMNRNKLLDMLDDFPID